MSLSKTLYPQEDLSRHYGKNVNCDVKNQIKNKILLHMTDRSAVKSCLEVELRTINTLTLKLPLCNIDKWFKGF